MPWDTTIYSSRPADFTTNLRGQVFHRGALLPRMQFDDYNKTVQIGCMVLTYDAVNVLIKEFQFHQPKTYNIT